MKRIRRLANSAIAKKVFDGIVSTLVFVGVQQAAYHTVPGKWLTSPPSMPVERPLR